MKFQFKKKSFSFSFFSQQMKQNKKLQGTKLSSWTKPKTIFFFAEARFDHFDWKKKIFFKF